jgi:membrane fusion protein (multidrug efflux system)
MDDLFPEGKRDASHFICDRFSPLTVLITNMPSSLRPGNLTLVLVASLALAACNSSAPTGATPPGGAKPPQDVGVVTLQTQPVTLSTDLPGRTSPFRVAEVRPQVNGVLQSRMFTEGTDVKKGDQLYQIDPAPYQAALDSALAQLQHAQAAEGIAKAQADRYQALKGSNAISKADYDTTMATQAQALADIAAAKAAVETAQINLTYTKVLAPISGRTGRSITEGALVTANQSTALVTIQQLDPIYVDIPQSTVLITRLRREVASGQIKSVGNEEAPITLSLEDGSPYEQSGTLQFSEVTVDQSTGSVILRAVFPNPKAFLLPGMFVTAHIEEGVADQGILVPQQGVMRDPRGQASVFLVSPGDKVELRNIKTDRAIGDKWLVTQGLAAGDRVIIRGLQKVAPGAAVVPQEMTQDDIQAAAAQVP